MFETTNWCYELKYMPNLCLLAVDRSSVFTEIYRRRGVKGSKKPSAGDCAGLLFVKAVRSAAAVSDTVGVAATVAIGASGAATASPVSKSANVGIGGRAATATSVPDRVRAAADVRIRDPRGATPAPVAHWIGVRATIAVGEAGPAACAAACASGVGKRTGVRIREARGYTTGQSSRAANRAQQERSAPNFATAGGDVSV